ncbi:hypothetical protein GGF37_004796 [Kickxella alabastrina]|nr:hypothetical protein GGF37_004796 [Kickxella alabastrina]
MDAKTVRALLADLDVESYHSATVEVLTDEEVWPPEIEDSFLKAAHLFATVGQRKYQLDPKMPNSRTTELSGRNDIISRYIFMMTGRFRARKQVSSHIQVWAHCKRAPSSHNMNLDTFLELQTLFREHYTRTSTGFQGSTKKKIRRVVSTSNVDALKKLSSNGSCSLGIGNGAVRQLSLNVPFNERKHALPSTPEQPSKRARRVVSELPHSSLDSLVSGSTGFSPQPFGGNTELPLWASASHEQAFEQLPLLSGSHLTPHSMLQPQTPVSMCGSMLMPPTFSIGLSPSHPHHMYNFPPGLVPTSASGPSLTVADIAALASLEDSFGSPMIYPSECIPTMSTPMSGSFVTGIPGGMFSVNSNIALPGSPGSMSAFATAVNTDNSSHYLNQPFSIAQIDPSAAAVLSADSSQDFAHVFGKYYDDVSNASSSNLQFLASEHTGIDISSAFAVDDHTLPWARALAHSSSRVTNFESTGVSAAAVDSIAHISHLSQSDNGSALEYPEAKPVLVLLPKDYAPPVAQPQATSESGAAQFETKTAKSKTKSKPKPKIKSEPKDALKVSTVFSATGLPRRSYYAALDTTSCGFSDVDAYADAAAAVSAKHKSGDGYREFFKYIQSNPSSAQSMYSVGQDSDTTTAGYGSSPPPQPSLLQLHGMPMSMPPPMDSHYAVACSAADAIAVETTEAVYPYTLPTDIGCSEGSVVDWINSLRGMLEANGIDPSLLPEDGSSNTLAFPSGEFGGSSIGGSVDIGSDSLFSMLYNYLAHSS